MIHPRLDLHASKSAQMYNSKLSAVVHRHSISNSNRMTGQLLEDIIIVGNC